MAAIGAAETSVIFEDLNIGQRPNSPVNVLYNYESSDCESLRSLIQGAG